MIQEAAATVDSAPQAQKPLYEDEHSSCSVMVGRIRNDQELHRMSPADQFKWLHRFYLVIDRIAEQHRVYKLYGGAHGFLFSTAVAEPDENHAATLLRFALVVHQAAQSIRFPSKAPVDLCLCLASGEASSGLLGSTSLTYQIVGRCMYEAQELQDTQREVPFLVAGSMLKELTSSVVSGLQLLGKLPVRRSSRPSEDIEVYTLPRYSSLRLTRRLRV